MASLSCQLPALFLQTGFWKCQTLTNAFLARELLSKIGKCTNINKVPTQVNVNRQLIYPQHPQQHPLGSFVDFLQSLVSPNILTSLSYSLPFFQWSCSLPTTHPWLCSFFIVRNNSSLICAHGLHLQIFFLKNHLSSLKLRLHPCRNYLRTQELSLPRSNEFIPVSILCP